MRLYILRSKRGVSLLELSVGLTVGLLTTYALVTGVSLILQGSGSSVDTTNSEGMLLNLYNSIEQVGHAATACIATTTGTPATKTDLRCVVDKGLPPTGANLYQVDWVADVGTDPVTGKSTPVVNYFIQTTTSTIPSLSPSGTPQLVYPNISDPSGNSGFVICDDHTTSCPIETNTSANNSANPGNRNIATIHTADLNANSPTVPTPNGYFVRFFLSSFSSTNLKTPHYISLQGDFWIRSAPGGPPIKYQFGG